MMSKRPSFSLAKNFYGIKISDHAVSRRQRPLRLFQRYNLTLNRVYVCLVIMVGGMGKNDFEDPFTDTSGVHNRELCTFRELFEARKHSSEGDICRGRFESDF